MNCYLKCRFNPTEFVKYAVIAPRITILVVIVKHLEGFIQVQCLQDFALAVVCIDMRRNRRSSLPRGRRLTMATRVLSSPPTRHSTPLSPTGHRTPSPRRQSRPWVPRYAANYSALFRRNGRACLCAGGEGVEWNGWQRSEPCFPLSSCMYWFFWGQWC